MSIIKLTPYLKLFTYGMDNTLELLNNLTVDHSKIDVAISKISTDVEANKLEISTLDMRVETIEDSMDEFTTQITNEVNDIKNNVDTSLADFDTRLSKNESDIASLKPENIRDLENRVTLAETQIKNNSELITGLTRRIDDDEDNLSQHAIRLDSLDAELLTQKNDLSNLTLEFNNYVDGTNTELNEIKTNIQTNSDNITQLSTEVNSLQSAVEGSQESIITNANAITALAQQISNLQDRMSHTESLIINLDERVRALEEKGG